MLPPCKTSTHLTRLFRRMSMAVPEYESSISAACPVKWPPEPDISLRRQESSGVVANSAESSPRLAIFANKCKKVLQSTTTLYRRDSELMPSQDDLYKAAMVTHGRALDRLARSYEANLEDRRDLLQEIHLALWRSFETFDARCSLRTWVYRVAHNVATSHVMRSRRMKSKALVSLDELDDVAGRDNADLAIDRNETLERLLVLIQRLDPLDRQVIVLYLEGMDAASIGEITGISSRNVATKIHRIKKILADRFRKGGSHGE
jgi:RNA polymerase sigma-70 factor, ECF subfamily